MSKTTPLLSKNPDIEAAVEAGLLSPDQAGPLADFWNKRGAFTVGSDGLTPITALYYLGGMLAIGAAVLFTSLVVENFGNKGLLGLALTYAVICLQIALYLQRFGLHIPAGIFAVLATVMIPVAVFAGGSMFEQTLKDERFRMLIYLACIAASVVMLTIFGYPFMVMPIAASVLVLAMDIVPHLVREVPGVHSWELPSWISLILGLLTIAIAMQIDIRTVNALGDYAFWLYLSGCLSFGGSVFHLAVWANRVRALELTLKLLALTVYTAMVMLGSAISRRTFVAVGGLGVLVGVLDMFISHFSGDFAFILLLTFTGFFLVSLGIIWSKNEAVISAFLATIFPTLPQLATVLTVVSVAAAVIGALYLTYLKWSNQKDERFMH